MRTMICVTLFTLPLVARSEEFMCSFATGVTTSLEDAAWGKYEPGNESSPMMLGYIVVMSEDQVRKMLYAAKQTKDAKGIALTRALVERAEVTGFSGWVEGADGYAGPLTVIRGNESATFVEATAVGNVTMTTLYTEQRTADGRIPAVHSRHMSVLGRGLVSHYTGACIRKTKG